MGTGHKNKVFRYVIFFRGTHLILYLPSGQTYCRWEHWRRYGRGSVYIQCVFQKHTMRHGTHCSRDVCWKRLAIYKRVFLFLKLTKLCIFQGRSFILTAAMGLLLDGPLHRMNVAEITNSITCMYEQMRTLACKYDNWFYESRNEFPKARVSS